VSAGSPRRTSGSGLLRKVLRYGTGSLVATACSEAVFLLLYGVLSTSTTTASVLGWLAGALPNYWMNRTWTWGRRGRPSLRHELLPYVAIVALTLLLAVGATALVDSALAGTESDTVRSGLVGGTFLLVYVLVFLLRFFLFDRLFTQQQDPAPQTLTEETP
jgi:putative flippase GtrA